MGFVVWILGTLLFVYICSKIKEAFFTTQVEEHIETTTETYVPEPPAAQPEQPRESLYAKEPASVYRAPRMKTAPALSTQPLQTHVIHETRVIHQQDDSLLNTLATAALVGELLDDRRRDRVIERDIYIAPQVRDSYVAPRVTELDDTNPDQDMSVSDQDQAGDVESMQSQDDESMANVADSASSDDDSDMSMDNGSDDNASYNDSSSSDSSSYDSGDSGGSFDSDS